MTARFELKAATEDLHRELDERLSRLDLGKAEDYERFLSLQARAVPPIEAALAANGIGVFVACWPASRRAPALEADLAALGLPMPHPMAVPVIDGNPELLGTAYVLEGSRLGGRVLRRQVGPNLPARFLTEGASPGPWPALVAAIDRSLYSRELIGEAASAARHCFALFLNVAVEAGI